MQIQYGWVRGKANPWQGGARLLPRLIGALILGGLVFASGIEATSVSAQDESVLNRFKRIADGSFLENLGQWDEEARFRAGGNGEEVWFAPGRLMLALYEAPPAPDPLMGEAGPEQLPEPEPLGGHAVEVAFVDANETEPVATGEQPGDYNWLVGDLDVTGAHTYDRITYPDLWDGIDLQYWGDADPEGHVKALYVVAPGADSGQIALRYSGQDRIWIDEQQQLQIDTPLGRITDSEPIAYTQSGQPVEVSYVLEGDTLRFDVAGYAANETLYIDPSVIFSRRFGTTSTDYTLDMETDGSNRYFASISLTTGFPTTGGVIQPNNAGSYDWLFTKFDQANNVLIWATYMGSTTVDYGAQIELMPNGNLIVGGFSLGAHSTGIAGVIPPIPANTTASTTYQAVVFEINSTATGIVRSARFGGNTTTYVGSIKRHPITGDIYVMGETFVACTVAGTCGLGPAGGFQPVQTGLDTASGYVTRLDPTLASATGFTYIAGNSTDGSIDARFDAAGNIYVVSASFSTTFPFTTTLIGSGGGYDFLIHKLNSALSGVLYNPVRIGGSSTDLIIGFSYFTPVTSFAGSHPIEVTSDNRVVFTGATLSTNFPTAGNPFQANNGGNYDYVVGVLNATGTALDEATYYGGTSTDYGRDVGINALNEIWVAGGTASTNFPVVNAVQATNAGNYDYGIVLFTGALDTSATLGATFWGAASTDIANNLIPNAPRAQATISGDTALSGSGFPAVPPGSPVFGPGGSYDGGVVRLTFGGALLEVTDVSVVNEPFEPRPEGVVCTGPADFVDWTITVVNTGISDQNDLLGPEVELNLDGPHVLIGCTADSGSCDAPGAGSDVEWNGFLAGGGGTVVITVRTRIQGALPAGTVVSLSGQLNFDADEDNEVNDTSVPIGPFNVELDCLPTVDPNAQLGKQVHLPILNFQGQDDVCRTWIEVQYIGCDPSKAVLVTWGEPGFCPPQAAGPLKVECTGLLNPGSTWNLLGAQIPTGSKSGILFKFTAQQLSDVGLDDDLGFDDVVADLMCETLFFGVVGDSDDYRRFKKAYNEGLDFAGIDQGMASGTGILAVEVLRHCPGDVTPGVEVSSRYNGIAGTHLGTYDPIFGGHGYYVPLIYAEKAGLNTVMYIQNGGLECSSVEIWFKAQDDCLRARICEIFTLAPGESYQWDASDCVGPDWQGSAWLRASQPMGIAVDIFGRDILMTYIGEPQPYHYVFDDGTGELEFEDFDQGDRVLFGPLMYSEYQGWDTGVQVMNQSEVYNAKVKVYFLDRSGDVITTLVDWICPRGSQTFFLPVVADLPGSWVGSIRVESQDWWTPGTNEVSAPNIVAVATLIKYSDVARTEAQEAIAYSLLPEHKAFDWQVGFAGGGTDNGVALIAIPSLLKDLDNTGTTSELAIMNLVSKPGFTDFAIYIYDQNGLLDFVCQKLHDRQVEYIDLQTWGYVSNGFKGSAIIKATFWEHEVWDGTGFFLRNLVGLGAVSVERTGTRLGEDVPGDEAAGSRGIPFAVGQIQEFEHCFADTPVCPGQPVIEPPKLTNFEGTFNVNAGSNGNQILDNQTQEWSVEVVAPGCVVEDVNLELDITHTFIGDLVVNLNHDGTGSMYTNICGSLDDWLGTLDDDAGSPGPDSGCGNTDPSLVTTTQSGSGLDSHDGKQASGTWTLSIQDTAGGDTGTLNASRFYGQCE